MMKKCKPNQNEAKVIDNKGKPEFSEMLNILSIDNTSSEVKSEDDNKENLCSNILNNRKKGAINAISNKPKESVFTSFVSQKLDGKELNDFCSQPKSSLKLQNTREFVPKNKPQTNFTEFKIEYAISKEATI